MHRALIVICALAILPFAWMVSTSLKTLEATMAYPPRFLPSPIQWHNYLDVFRDPKANFLLWARNTLIIAVLGVTGTTLSSALVAYGFARIRFIGRRALFGVMLSTLMIPFPVTMVPLFALFRWLGDHTGVQWLGTFKPLWLPLWFGSAFNIFLLRQFFMTIPTELSEAAHRWMQRAGHLLADHPAAVAPGTGGGGALCIHGDLERFPRSAGLSSAPRAFHAGAGLAEFPKQSRRHVVASADGRQHAGGGADDPAVFPAQKTFIEGIATTGTKG